ncbi:hypothetical protein DFA_08037 [Cavenderia fasciculata]|uniref:Uncharacterized protein n=1 Tax=Cavenderia fasciculata TaxID=261658 RepID=F4Q4P7_CACFS|nr:uncharacterized protein DFA_08037 [Cavenderia fasciculata]EGG17056.1 hypothetical protein DFA_08037 [Cavenderia fasciculata]|eukprot:XP_004355540.1 hypothetical protein DFA_08037 [Cavenderia fasciculata]
MTDILSLSSLSIDKYKELISVGVKSILSRTYSKYDKILFVGSLALPFLVNLPIYGIVPNERDKRVESFYESAIEKITLAYDEISADYMVESQDIREMANIAEKCNKLCRILAKREVVQMLLGIINGAEEIWETSYSHQIPLSEEATVQLYNRLENDNIMIDCTDLLNHILPFVQDIPYELFFKVISFYVTSPSSYQLTCAALKTMTLRKETILPFINDGMLNIVRLYISYELKSEYSLLRDYWLQIARIIYKDRKLFRSLLVEDRRFVEEYYEMGRFKLWLPQDFRVPPHNMLYEIVSDGFGYYLGWVNKTGLLVDNIIANNTFSDWIYRRLDSTLSRYLYCSIFASSFSLYFTFLLPPKGKIYYIASAVTSLAIYKYKELISIGLKSIQSYSKYDKILFVGSLAIPFLINFSDILPNNCVEYWHRKQSQQVPLSGHSIHLLYTTIDNHSIMSCCTNLLNHIFPWLNVIEYSDIIYKTIYRQLKLPTGYKLTCTVFKSMILKPETIQPFINVGMIKIVRFYLTNQFKSEYTLLLDYWLQIAKNTILGRLDSTISRNLDCSMHVSTLALCFTFILPPKGKIYYIAWCVTSTTLYSKDDHVHSFHFLESREMTEDISSLSIDKYKELISIGLKSILSTTYIPIYGILPNNQDKRIESFYNHGIEKILNVYSEIETNHRIVVTQDIRDMATLTEKNNKLCRILAQRDIVFMLLRIILGANQIWENGYSHQAPLSEYTIHQIYTHLENDNMVLDCTDLLNNILPFLQDIPFELFYKVIYYHSLSPTSYKLTLAVLRTMTLKPETIPPFVIVGMVDIVRVYLQNEVKSEYSQLRDYWVQIARVLYKDEHFEQLPLVYQSLIEEYYKKGRFKSWIPKELRLPPIGTLHETITDVFGYYQGWLNGTTILVDYIFSNSIFSDTIYRRLDSTLVRYLTCSLFTSSLSFYFTMLLPRKGKIFYISSGIISILISFYQDKLIANQKTSGTLYKSFKECFQTPVNQNDRFFESTKIININNKSDILNYRF